MSDNTKKSSVDTDNEKPLWSVTQSQSFPWEALVMMGHIAVAKASLWAVDSSWKSADEAAADPQNKLMIDSLRELVAKANS